MNSPVANRVMSPLNMILPFKSEGAVKEILATIASKKSDLLNMTDSIGTVHFARLVDVGDANQRQFGFLTEFDGDFRQYFGDFIKYLGPMFDILFQGVVDGPPVPCQKNTQAFIDWAFAHNPNGIGFYSAYPSLSVQDIRARAKVTHGSMDEGVQSPLTLALPAKSPAHLTALGEVLERSLPKLYAAADKIGTIHFARFLPFGARALFIVEHDGTLEKLSEDLATNFGPVFDEIFEHVANPPPTAVAKNTRAFADWVSANNRNTVLFYRSYPSLSVQAIREGAQAH